MEQRLLDSGNIPSIYSFIFENNNLYLSRNLSFLRKNKKLSQADLAAALRIKRTTYANYENGTTEPSYELLIYIANFLGTSIDDLLTKKLEEHDLDGQQSNENQQAYAYLDPRTAKELSKQIEDLRTEIHELRSQINKSGKSL